MPVMCKMDESIHLGLEHLERSCRPITGFQTDCIGSSRTSMESQYFPETIFLNLMALDMLGDHLSPKTKRILRNSVCPDESSLSSTFSFDVPNGKPYYTGTINFNKYKQIIPDDTDDTGLYHYIALRDGLLEKDDRRLQDIARLIYLNVAKDGCIRMYYPPMDKRRVDIIDEGSMANAMKFLYLYEVDPSLFQKSEDHLYNWMVSRKYLGGTRYYPSPDAFLYFCTDAVCKSPRALSRFQEPLLREIKARAEYIVKLEQKVRLPLDVSPCLLALCCFPEAGSPELEKIAAKLCEILVSMQRKDQDGNNLERVGEWPADALYKRGRTETYLCGSDVSTIFAVAALIAYKRRFYDDDGAVVGITNGISKT